MQKIRKFILTLVKTVIKAFFFLFPVKDNKILFINFGGRGYGCNPKYIAEEILKRNLPFDLVWSVLNENEALPKGIRRVKHAPNIKYFYEIATARVIVANVKNDLFFYKKKTQYVIQTWHGSYSSKKLEGAASDSLPAKYLGESQANSKQTDLFLSNSRVLSDCYRKDFWCECEILECGFPRNDILFYDNTATLKAVKDYFKIPENCKIALYAPTFRDDNSVDGYKFNALNVLNALKKQGSDWKLLIRMHPNVAENAELFTYDNDILNATPYPDMQELLSACDALITDYSSSVFEIAALKKAIYIYANDIAEYDKMRGLLPTFFQMPYKINENEEDLIETIINDTPMQITENAESFIEIFGSTDNGHASECVVDRICEVIQRKR